MEKKLAWLAIGLVFVIGIALGVWLRSLKHCPDVPDVRPDTLWLYDTVTIDHPVPVDSIPKGYELVPAGTVDRYGRLIAALEDSLSVKPKVIIRDSLVYIEVPMEQKHYSDSLYDAWVSGYEPSLDSIRVFPRTAIVEVPVYKSIRKPWGLGVQVGGTYLPKVGFTPYVGLGVSYNILTF